MKTYKRICLDDHIETDGKLTLKLQRGTEYITSADEDGFLTVFASVWAKVPASWFAGEKVFTKA